MDHLNRSLKLIREYHRLKQNDLAQKLEISASYLSEIEKGTKAPTIELLRSYSEVFRIPLSSIIIFSEMQGRSSKDASVKIADKALKMLEWILDTNLPLKSK